ncbi:MAG: hypothetical protein J0I92_16170, partial [Phyllobacterium sp.]|nr:hypothetical protein [Phyllobacterium sp.]
SRVLQFRVSHGAGRQPDGERPAAEQTSRSGVVMNIVNDDGSTSSESCPTVRERCSDLPERWLQNALERGLIMIDGIPVTDLDTKTLPGSEITIGG